MNDLNFLHSGFTEHCTATVDKHFVGYYTLQFMTAGAVDLYYGNSPYELRTPMAWTAFPGPRIRFHRGPDAAWWTHRYAAFTGARVAQWVSEGLWFQEPQQAAPTEKFEWLFDDLLQHAARTDQWNCRAATAILERILIELALERERAQLKHCEMLWLQAVLAALEGSFAPDYDAMAKQRGMSISTLRRRFLQLTGKPIHLAAIEARINLARSMLGETDKPLKAIAAELGYADEYFFARQFKQMAGVAPAAYRRSRQ